MFFDEMMDSVITGHGFKRSIPGIDINSLRDADGTILTASTEPSREALETSFIGAVVSSSQTDLGTLTFMVPRDYDADVDKMRVRFLANSGGTTNAPTIDAALYQKRAGVALSSDLDPTISAAVSKASATTGTGWVEVAAEGLGLQAGDAVTFVFTTSAHTTDALNVYALEVVYIGDLAYYKQDERDDWAR